MNDSYDEKMAESKQPSVSLMNLGGNHLSEKGQEYVLGKFQTAMDRWGYREDVTDEMRSRFFAALIARRYETEAFNRLLPRR